MAPTESDVTAGFGFICRPFRTPPYGVPYCTVLIVVGRAPTTRRDTWVECGLSALLTRGTHSVTVEGLARDLGVTKGSFYWHFTNRDDLLTAVLDRWREARTDDLVNAAESSDDPLQALTTIFTLVGATGGGEAGLYVPTGEQHPLVTDALATVTATRITYLAGMLQRLGHPAHEAGDRARAALALAIGYQVLDRAVPGQKTSENARRRATTLALNLIHRPLPFE